jgi:hypothetical protein
MRTILLLFLSFTLASAGTQTKPVNKYTELFARAMRETSAKYSKPACACDITIPSTAWYIDKDKNTRSDATVLDVRPGMTVCFAAGIRGPIEFHSVNGTATAPITFVSNGGTTFKGSGGQHMVAFYNSSFIKVTGEQGPIDITGGGHGIWFGSLSTDVEAAFINFHDLGYSGFEAKTDPTCDPKTWRGNFTLRNVRVHDCTFKNMMTGEAIYIGESHYHSTFPLSGCTGGITSALEHEVKGVWVYNNTFDYTGHDAIQVGACTSDGYIYNNTLTRFGQTNEYGQMSGIQINPGTNADIHHNIISNGPGYAIFGGGRGGSTIHHNLMISTGKATDGGGILLQKYVPFDDSGFKVYNNTMIGITRYGIEAYPETGDNVLENNIINISSGLLVKLNSPATKLIDRNNVKVIGSSSLLKLDANYVPLVGSPAFGVDSDAGAFQSVKIKWMYGPGWEAMDSLGTLKAWLVTSDGKKVRVK